nr:transporter associated domain-containing protein [Bifidobacterium porcinum]
MTNILDTAQRPAKSATVPTTPTALITPTNSNATDGIIGIASNAAANQAATDQAATTNHFNHREKQWILYDVGNSAFVLLSTAVIPIYANSLLKAAGESNIVSTWGYMQTIASLIIALLMPILGSIADVQGMKIKFFIGFFGTGVLACCAMALPLGWIAFLAVCMLATIGLNGSLTFYDSMLIDTTTNDRMDQVSNGVATVDGGTTLEDFADLTGIVLDDGPYETVAGYFLAHTGKMGEVGDVLHTDDGYDMVITKVDGRRIDTVEVRRQINLPENSRE